MPHKEKSEHEEHQNLGHFILVRRPQSRHWGARWISCRQFDLSLKPTMRAMNPKSKMARSWRRIVRHRRRNHDSMLVFNSSSGWREIFNPLKARENAG
jgi:hypothetical protein